MSGVSMIEVTEADAGQRLDRWLRGKYPNLGQGKLQKLLRTGQIRIDGARAKAGDRVDAGQSIRIPPNIDSAPETPVQNERPWPKKRMHEDEAARIGDELKSRILYMDDDIIAIDKPYGLAVQGGSGTRSHIDGALDRLKMGAGERPRLVHRLDRDTTGVLLLARNRRAAAMLGDAFQKRETRKIYWALVAGLPPHQEGLINAPLSKRQGKGGERMRVDYDEGKKAETRFRVIDHASKSAAWLELEPFTGRTHQLRVHCEIMDTPIVGDHKYGRRGDLSLEDAGIEDKLHLHAHRLVISLPGRKPIDISAPLPPHMADTWQRLGFDPRDEQAQAPDL